MTKDEIKAQVTMRDLLERYGIRANRAGFAHCPFHQGDREPSMKVYEKDFHCFGCGANGDVFSFVMQMERCSFSEAFKRLGGDYKDEDKFSARLARRNRLYEAERRRKRLAELREAREKASRWVAILRHGLMVFEPLTDEWCFCQNELQLELERLEELWRNDDVTIRENG